MDTQVKPQRKAVVPTRAIVWALEQGAEGALGEPGPGVDQSSRQVHYGDGQVQPGLQCALQRRAAHLAADGQVHEQHPGAASLADEDHVGSGHQTEPGPAHRPIVLLLGGQMVDPLGEVVEEIQGLGGVSRDGLPDPHDQQGQDGLHPPPRNPRQNFRGTPSGSSCRIVHSRRTYRGTSASTWETGSRSPRRMSTPGRSDTWCAPSGTRFSRSSKAGRAVRVDLGHEDKVECPASPKALFKEVPDTPPSNASWDVIPAMQQAGHHQGLLDTDGVTVGCGWRPGPLKISELAEQDFHAEPEMYLGCTRCFRHFTFPNT